MPSIRKYCDKSRSTIGDGIAEDSGADVCVRTPTLSVRKKLIFAAVVTAAVLSVLEGVLWLAGVRPDLDRVDPYAGFVSHIPHFVARSENGSTTLMGVAPSKRDVLNDISFPAPKPQQTFRIVCLGGSTTFGRPFFDQTSFAGWLRLWLPVAAPEQKWELINAGAISYASYRVARLMEELSKYQPDLFIIYVGENEFLERRTYDEMLKQPSWWREFISLPNHTCTAAAIRRGLEGAGVLPAPIAAQQSFTDKVNRIPIDSVGPEAYHRDESFRSDVIAHFKASLEEMVVIANRVGARVLLVVPASNLGDFAPFKSEFGGELSGEQRQVWQSHYDAALQAIRRDDSATALNEVNRARAIDDRRADLHFVRGRALAALSRFNEAADAFHRAKEEDICPLRAIDPILAVIRETANSPNVMVVDFAELVLQKSPHGIPDRTFFHDHVHPTINANRLLAAAILDKLASAGIARLSPHWNAEVAGRLANQYEATWDRCRMARELIRLADLLITLKQDGLATDQLRAAIDFGSESQDVTKTVAMKLEHVAGGSATVQVLRDFLANHPKSTSGHCELGIALGRRDRLSEALPEFEAALAMTPDCQTALTLAGLASAKLGDLAKSENYFRNLVEIAPQLAGAQENLAIVLAKQGREEEAVVHFRSALELDPTSVSAHRHAADSLDQLGQLDQAREHRRIASELAARPIRSQRNSD